MPRLMAFLLARPPWVERLLLAGAVTLCVCLYIPINHLTAGRAASELEGSVDRAIPFVVEWMAIYGLLYLFLLLPVVLDLSRAEFRRVAGAVLLTAVISFAFFLLWPVAMTQRPLEVSAADPFGWALALTHKVDSPTNCAPSLHVSLSLLAGLVVARHDPRLGRLLLPLAILIGVSTMFVKQHWWADVWTGWLLALIVWGLVLRGRIAAAVRPDRRGILLLLLLQILHYGLSYGLFRSGWIRPEALTPLYAG